MRELEERYYSVNELLQLPVGTVIHFVRGEYEVVRVGWVKARGYEYPEICEIDELEDRALVVYLPERDKWTTTNLLKQNSKTRNWFQNFFQLMLAYLSGHLHRS